MHNLPIKFKYLILSHHQRERSVSPCTTIYNVFLSPKAVYSHADYLFVHLSKKDFKEQLIGKVSEDVILLFNGCYSLLNDNSIYAINYAKSKNLPVVVYWHEMAWQLNKAATQESKYWLKIKELLREKNIQHWVPFSQGKQLIMYIFEKPYEDVLIVNEAIAIENYKVATRKQATKIRFLGAGVVGNKDAFLRKGVDYFCRICEKLSYVSNIDFQGYWLGASERDIKKFNIVIPENCKFLGFVKDFNNQIQDYDMFLLTSRDDPSPIVAFEALACDLPVFCFDSVGTREMLPKEFVSFDPGEMIDQITKYWNNIQDYPQNYFRNLAENYTTINFIEKINKTRGDLIVLNEFPIKQIKKDNFSKKTIFSWVNKLKKQIY